MTYRYVPQELVDLPFNLRRSQLNPVNPPLVDQAIEAQLTGSARPALMPGKTMYTKWHTGPARRGYLQTAISALAAGAVYTDKVSALTAPIEADKGIFTPFQASRALNRLPQPAENLVLDSEPIARNVLTRPITQAPGLDAFARGEISAVERQSLLSTALEGNMTPLGRVGWAPSRQLRARGGWLRGLGRLGMGFGALGDPLDVMGEASFDPNAQAIPLEKTSNQATPGANSQVVTTVTTPATPVTAPTARAPELAKWGQTFYALAGLVGAGAGIYHGWKRTRSTPWTVAWGIAGGLFPLITVPVAFVQGFGKRG